MRTIHRGGRTPEPLDPTIRTVVPVSPEQHVRQHPDATVIYELDAATWGRVGEPTVEPHRPKRSTVPLHVSRAQLRPGTWLRANDRRTRVITGQLGPCLEVSGGLAGAEYNVRIGDARWFRVRVTVLQEELEGK